MNFVDAAVALLREARVPLHVEELCRRALEQGLLDSPGQTPLRSLKGRLTTELKRGPESRVVRVEDDVWDLAHAGSNGAGDAADASEEAPGAGAAPGDVARHVSGHTGAGADDALATQKEAVSPADDRGADVGDLDDRHAGHVDSTATRADIDGELGDHDEDDDLDEDGELDDDEDDEDDDELDELDDDEDDEDDDLDRAAQPDERRGDADADRIAAESAQGQALAAEDEDDDDEDDDDEDDDDRAAAAVDEAAREAERAALTPEERELLQAYGDDAGTAQVSALVEYRDHQSADEDRRMVPETLPERRSRGGREDWKSRRDRMRDKRRERREERERTRAARGQGQAGAAGGEAASQGERAEGRSNEGRAHEGRSSEGRSNEGRSREGRSNEGRSSEGRASEGRASEASAGERPLAEPRREISVPVGDSSLAARACEVLASMKGAQPVPVRQLAQMMKKRRLVEADPEVLWRPLKSALLADSQRRAAAGLPPRVSYRGRDLFAYRPGANAELEAAEAGLESAAHRLRGATERALAARLVELPLPVLEQVVQLYLVQAGWRDIEWIKRVDRSGYAVASEPGEGGKVMVAARAGNQEVDRRGIGELRAGVAAKNLARGYLIAPRELGSEARAELEREGKPVGALCGLRWTAALVDAGIGVAQRAMPVAYLDPELFDRLGEG